MINKRTKNSPAVHYRPTGLLFINRPMYSNDPLPLPLPSPICSVESLSEHLGGTPMTVWEEAKFRPAQYRWSALEDTTLKSDSTEFLGSTLGEYVAGWHLKFHSNSRKHSVVNPFGSYEVDTVGVVLSTKKSGETYEAIEKDNPDFFSDVHINSNNMVEVELLAKGDLAIMGVFLILKNGTRVWANEVVGGETQTERFSYDNPMHTDNYRELTDAGFRLGVRSAFIHYITNGPRKFASGDILYVNRADSVIFRFGIPSSLGRSPHCIYDINEFLSNRRDYNSDYWYIGNGGKQVILGAGAGRLPVDFWEGREVLLKALDHKNSLIGYPEYDSIDLTYLFEWVMASRHGRVFQKYEGWDMFRNKMTSLPAKRTDDISRWSRNMKATYYLSHKLNTFALMHPLTGSTSFCPDNYIDIIVDYLAPCPLHVVEWIDFADIVADTGVAGFYTNFDSDTDFDGFLNIEESAFNVTSMPLANCSAFEPKAWKFTGYPNWWEVEGSNAFWGYRVNDVMDATDKKPYFAVEVLMHEIGHAIDSYYKKIVGKKLTETQEWLDITGWGSNIPYPEKPVALIQKDSFKIQTADGKETPVTAYACTHPMDDFAETYRFYMLNENFLKDHYPKRFAFMQKYCGYVPQKAGVYCANCCNCDKCRLWDCR